VHLKLVLLSHLIESTLEKDMELVFATHNQNKIREVQSLLPKNITLLSLADIGCFDEIPETETTFEGNAILKATYVLEHYGYSCFADDSGLEVHILNGAPGVHSARYAGADRDDDANLEKLLGTLRNSTNRTAQFTTVIALCSKNETTLFKGIIKGIITQEAKGKNGFGYDPVFQPEGFEKTFAELSLETKNKISHRAIAFRKLLAYLT
jgi:XTP/dITP diphosphohydrolase